MKPCPVCGVETDCSHRMELWCHTRIDLDAIRERWRKFRNQALTVGVATELKTIWENDIPAMVGEIERLRFMLSEVSSASGRGEHACPSCHQPSQPSPASPKE